MDAAKLEVRGITPAARILSGELLSRHDLVALVAEHRQGSPDLLSEAHQVRRAFFGDQVRFCSIVPGKLGHCPGDCKWCAQSHTATAIQAPYGRTSQAEILAAAERAVGYGSANLGIVNSGLRPSRQDLADVITAVRAIRGRFGDRIRICASLGEITPDQASRLAHAGLSRYHHNLETSRAFFPRMVTTHTYDTKIRTLRAARSAGLEVCCGGLLGLGETWEDRVDLALVIRDEVAPDVVPLNFLVPIPGTAMGSASPMPPYEILAGIAIKVAGGRETNLQEFQPRIFHAGATSCMIGDYLTTAGQTPAEDLRMLQDLGLRPVQELTITGTTS
jgi:biotin synthase